MKTRASVQLLWVGAIACTVGGVVVAGLVPRPWGLSGLALVALGLLGAGLARRLRRPRTAPEDGALSVGWPSALVTAFAILQYPILVGAVTPFITMGIADRLPFLLPAYTLGPIAGLGLILSIAMLVAMGRRALGTRGRVRVSVVAAGMLLRSIGYGILAAVLSLALRDPNALMLGLGLEESLMPVGQMPALAESFQLVTSAQGTYQLLQVGLVVGGVGALLELIASLTCWFLLPQGFRRWFWGFADTLLLVGFVAVTLLLPIRPDPATPNDITFPSIRLAVTAAFTIRALFRLIPIALDGLEQVGIRALVAARMIRAKKSGFLTTIGALSIMAVSFSSCTLTTTLSVMGGFRNDLKEKILGNNAHVVVDREHGTFEGWVPILETVRAQDEVIAATPYVQGEVMITSSTNLGGAVLRGIDPDTIGDVTELPRNLRHGQMDYLREPERLLRLRPAEMGAGLLSPQTGSEAVARGSLLDDVAAVLDDAREHVEAAEAEGLGNESESTSPLDDPDRIADEIDEFLREDEDLADSQIFEEPAMTDVLPGVIVGQELARTLRLHVGDEVNLVSPLGELGPAGPMPRSRPFRVAGIFYSGMYEFDMKMAYTTLEAAQSFLNVGEAISGIEAKVEDTDRAEPVAVAIQQALGARDLRVRAWQEVNRNLFGALQLEKLAMFITLGIAILVASFCIVGTLSLMVQEKRKEVGILKAMGATGQQIVAVFMTQGLMIGSLGAATGLGLGYLTCFIMEHFGIHLNPEVYYIDRLPVHIDASEFVVTGIASVIVCLLATIYPAILGSRLTPLDALRSS
ncbi:MAG: ABC transporter permease [Sandaracinaceae bacterium]|nr:ABC transporter permease [Sandaracinaceae bacterium]